MRILEVTTILYMFARPPSPTIAYFKSKIKPLAYEKYRLDTMIAPNRYSRVDQMPERPFDDLIALASQIPTLPQQQPDINDGSLRLDRWFSNAQHRDKPNLEEIHICILASSYSAESGAEVDTSQVEEFIVAASRGQTRVNQLCKSHGLGLRVLELAPTLPHVVGQNWTEADCMAAVAFGMEATAAGGDALCLGSFSANDQLSSKTFGEEVKRLRSSDADAAPTDYLNILRTFGGRDTAAALGALLAARSRQLPVLIEGWAALNAYSVFREIAPDHVDHVLLASVQNVGQLDWANELSLKPLVGVNVDAGPGCGLALAVSLVIASCA